MARDIEWARDLLLGEIDGARYFRERKAEEYPDDPRNERSARELEKLYAHVQALPSDHPLLVSWAAIPADDELAIKIREEALEEAPGMGPGVFGRYGFHSREDPETFCRELAAAIDETVRAHYGSE